MKETEARIDFDSHQLLLYVEKNNGQYGPLQTGSFLTKNYVDDFWEKQRKLAQSALNHLCSGKISPVGYYMLMIDISAGEIAARLGISKRKVKKHQEFSHFSKLKLSLLSRYADIFGIPLANMFQVLVPSNVPYTFIQKKTSTPFVVTTEIIEEKK